MQEFKESKVGRETHCNQHCSVSNLDGVKVKEVERTPHQAIINCKLVATRLI